MYLCSGIKKLFSNLLFAETGFFFDFENFAHFKESMFYFILSFLAKVAGPSNFSTSVV